MSSGNLTHGPRVLYLLTIGLVAALLGGLGQPVLAHFVSVKATLVFPSSKVVALSDAAYDDKHNVYLQVWGDAPGAWAQLVKPDGTVLGPKVQLNPPASPTCPSCKYGQSPRVVYTAGSTDDVFIVVLSSDRISKDKKTLWLQLVKYTPTGAQLVGGNVQATARTMILGHNQTGTGIVYDRLRKEFLITWTELRAVNGKLDYDAFARIFSLTRNGDLVTGIGAGQPDLNLSNNKWPQGESAASFDAAGGTYFVVFKGGKPDNLASEQIGIWGRVINPATNTISPFTTIGNVGGFQVEPTVTYLPQVGRYLVAWTTTTSWPGSGGLNLAGRLVIPGTGQPVGSIFPVLASSTAEGGAHANYNDDLNKAFVGAMHGSKNIWGVELSGAGAVLGNFKASTPVTTNGSYNPRITPGPNGEFGLSYVLNNTKVYFERLTDTPGTGGGPSPPSQPPPPPGGSKPYTWIDTPINNQTVPGPFTLKGWAVDLAAPTGDGVDAIHIYAYKVGGGQVGPAQPTTVSRPDVGAAFGAARFSSAGYAENISLGAGTWDIVVNARSTVTQAWNVKTVRVHVP